MSSGICSDRRQNMQIADLAVADTVVDGVGLALQLRAVRLRQALRVQLRDQRRGYALNGLRLFLRQIPIVRRRQQPGKRLGQL